MRYYNPLTHHVRTDKETGNSVLVCNSSHQVVFDLRRDTTCEPELPFELVDSSDMTPSKKGRIRIDKAITVHINGYGDFNFGHLGEPILIEQYEGTLRVALWADINKEDCTNSISMEGARLTRQTDSTEPVSACELCRADTNQLLPHPDPMLSKKVCASCLYDYYQGWPSLLKQRLSEIEDSMEEANPVRPV